MDKHINSLVDELNKADHMDPADKRKLISQL